MPNYAFGTAGRDESLARADLSTQTRQRNISDLLNGVGVLAQSLGAMHRYKQEQANKDVLADFYVRSLASPGGEPGAPLPEGVAGPVPEKPWDTAIGERMQADRKPAGGFLEGIGNFFNPTGKLEAGDAMKLADSIRNRNAQQAQAALDERKVKVDEFNAAVNFKKGEYGRIKDMVEAAAAMKNANTAARNAGNTAFQRDATALQGEQGRADKLEARVSTLNQRMAEADKLLFSKDMNAAVTMAFFSVMSGDKDNAQMQQVAEKALGIASPEAQREAVKMIRKGLQDERDRVSGQLGGMRQAGQTYQDRVIKPAAQRLGGPAEAQMDPMEVAGRKFAKDNGFDYDNPTSEQFDALIKHLSGGQ